MCEFISQIKHSHPIFIRYTNARLRLEFVYQTKIGCSCFIYHLLLFKYDAIFASDLYGIDNGSPSKYNTDRTRILYLLLTGPLILRVLYATGPRQRPTNGNECVNILKNWNYYRTRKRCLKSASWERCICPQILRE